MKRFFFWTLVVLSLAVLSVRFGSPLVAQVLGNTTRAGVKITAVPEAVVFLNGVEMGKTPLGKDNLKPGEYEVKLVAPGGVWQNTVELNQGTFSVVNREIPANIASSSGEILTLNPGQGIIITSNPSETEVEIDGKSAGKTPLSMSSLPPGEHTLLLSHPGYLKRSIQALLPEKLQLHLSVDLALSEAELAPIPALPDQVAVVLKVVVKQTPNGFLRVRDKPSTAGKEVAKASSGDILILLDKLSGWDKVRLSNGIEGYVSSAYVAPQ